MTGEAPASDMRFCGDPTADFDEAGIHLRTWYETNCPELHLGGWRGALRRGIRRVLFGYRDYDVNRDRHGLMLGLINEVQRIERERARQVGDDPLSILRAKADDQMAYWRKRMAEAKSLDDGVSEDGLTYTPIGDGAAWEGGRVNGRLSEAEWWQSTLKYMAPAPAMEARRAGTQGGPVHDSAVREAKAPKDGPALAEGDAHPLPDPLAGITTDPRLLEALKRSAAHEMTPAEHHAQRRSWIIGEMGIEHPEMSRERLEALADHAVGPAPNPHLPQDHHDRSGTGSEVKED